jgi:hypothetical protein
MDQANAMQSGEPALQIFRAVKNMNLALRVRLTRACFDRGSDPRGDRGFGAGRRRNRAELTAMSRQVS